MEGRSLPSTFTVTDLGDAGVGADLQGDLRYCITQANANPEIANQIVFDPSLAGFISLTQGTLAITKDVELIGPGASLLTVSGNHRSGVFAITADPSAQNVRISGLTIADGTGVPIPSGQGGGGLYNAHATVTLTGVTLTGNAVKGRGLLEGGGVYNDSGNLILESSTVTGNSVGDAGHGGGIYDNLGGLTIDSSTVSNNHAGVDGSGGGIATAGVFSGRPVTLTNCTVAGNSVSGSIGTGGGIENISHQLTISGCTISGNSSDEIAGGIFNVAATTRISDTLISGNFATRGGAGLDNDNGRVTLTDCSIVGNASSPINGFGGGINNNSQMALSGCTISGNSAYDGGGIFQAAGVLNLTNCTISQNSAAQGGGGIFANQAELGILQLTSVTITGNSAGGAAGFDSGGGGLWLYPPGIFTRNRVYLDNTLVAGNTTAAAGPDVRGTVLSVGYNLIGQADSSDGWGLTDLVGTSITPLDPHLGPLQDNGGPTWTHALHTGSPAIAAGDWALRETLDQRGTERIGSHPPDIGAFQAERIFSFRITAPSEVAPGEAFSVSVTALDIDGNTASTFVGGVHLTSSDSDGVLPEDYIFTSADGGIHTFTVTLLTPGPQTIQATDLGNRFHTGMAVVTVDVPPAAVPPWVVVEGLLNSKTEPAVAIELAGSHRRTAQRPAASPNALTPWSFTLVSNWTWRE